MSVSRGGGQRRYHQEHDGSRSSPATTSCSSSSARRSSADGPRSPPFLFVHDGDDPFAEIRVSDLLGHHPVTFSEMCAEYRSQNIPMTHQQLEKHWRMLKLADIRRSPILDNEAVTFSQLEKKLLGKQIITDKTHLAGVWDSMEPAERRVAPLLDDRPVVWEQFVGEYKKRGFPMTESQLKTAFGNLKLWEPDPERIQVIREKLETKKVVVKVGGDESSCESGIDGCSSKRVCYQISAGYSTAWCCCCKRTMRKIDCSYNPYKPKAGYIHTF